MKISFVDRHGINELKTWEIKKGNGKEFNKILKDTQREQSEQEIREMLRKIDEAGERLKKSKAFNEVNNYKQLIKDYLSYVVKNYYSVCQDRSYYNGLLSRVEVINEEVERLTQELLESERSNIDLAGQIDHIRGLLVDLFC